MENTKHCRRVTSLIKKFAKFLNYSDEMISYFAIGAAFHDVGKLFIPSELLDLPRRLSFQEFALIQRHPNVGYEILDNITENEIVLNMCLYHHERWDGSGYPECLKEEDIPIEARILAICDVYEALISERHYKSEIETQDALGIVTAKLGNHFDPYLGKKFVEFINEEQKLVLAKTFN